VPFNKFRWGYIWKLLYYTVLAVIQLVTVTLQSKRMYRSRASGFPNSHCGLYLSLSGMAPSYLAADCQLISDEGRRQLPTQGQVSSCRRTYSSYADRCFVAAGPKLWNSLPAHPRQTDIDFERFKRLLRAFLFRC